jgi:hypothetical protein
MLSHSHITPSHHHQSHEESLNCIIIPKKTENDNSTCLIEKGRSFAILFHENDSITRTIYNKYINFIMKKILTENQQYFGTYFDNKSNAWILYYFVELYSSENIQYLSNMIRFSARYNKTRGNIPNYNIKYTIIDIAQLYQ